MTLECLFHTIFIKTCVKVERRTTEQKRGHQLQVRMSIINIFRGLPCRLESVRLKFTNEPSIFVDGDLAELIKRSASDRLGDLVPRPGFEPGLLQGFSRHGASSLCPEFFSL